MFENYQPRISYGMFADSSITSLLYSATDVVFSEEHDQ